MDVSLVMLTAFIGLFVLLAFTLAKIVKPKEGESEGRHEPEREKEEIKSGGKPKGDQHANKKKLPASNKSGHDKQKDKYNHSWLVTSLKGHAGRVLDLDLSENGKYLATCDDDRSVLIWLTKEFGKAEHKMHRANVSYDHASLVKWSPDSKAFIALKASDNLAEVYKIGRRDDGGLGAVEPVVTFPCRHETDVVGMGFAATGQYVMTCSDKTTMIIWSIRGEVLATVDNYQMQTFCAKVSPCGRFVASSGFTPGNDSLILATRELKASFQTSRCGR